MTNYIKKPVSVILTFLLIISVFTIVPVSVSATTDESLFGFDNGTITSYSGSDTDIEIPDTINGTPVTAIGDYAFESSSITSVVIPDSVTSIGENAFNYCSSLTSVTIGESVETIGYRAFYSCYYLTNVVIPDSVTSIGEEVFYYAGLTSITLGDGLETIGNGAFQYCYYLTSIDIPDSVTSIGDNAFYYCSGLTSVTLGNSVQTIGEYAFYDCYNSNFKEITIPASTTSIGQYAFQYCSNLKKVTFLNSNTIIGNRAFYYCSNKLKLVGYDPSTAKDYAEDPNNYNVGFVDIAVGIPEYEYTLDGDNATITAYNGDDTVLELPSLLDDHTVTAIGSNAFASSDITSVTIPNSITSIGYSAFYYCASLTSVTIGSGVETIDNYAFYYCTGLTSIVIPDSVVSIGYDAFYYCTSLSSVTIGNGVELIDDYAFYYCTALTSIDIPGNVDTIDEYAFYNCTSLSSVTIGNGVENIGYYAFENCTVLTSVEIPDSVSYMGAEAFAFCYNLESVTIGSGLEYLDYYQFYDCSSLTEVTIYSRTVEIEDCAFEECPSNITFYGYTGSTTDTYASSLDNSYTFVPLAENISEYEYDLNGTNATITAYNGTDTEVEIPSQIYGYTVTAIGSGSFSGKTSLTSVSIPNTVTSIGNTAFAGCSSLVELTIPNGVISIGSNAFSSCSSLVELTIPDSVTFINGMICGSCSSLERVTFGSGIDSIGNYSFAGLSSLESVTFRNGITSIGNGAFAGCSNLTTAIIPRSVTSMGSGVFISSSNLTIYGYEGSYAESYASSQSPAIPFVPMFNTNKGDSYEGDALTGTQSRDSGDSSFNLSQNSYENIELLGVQKKTSRGANDMRFVAVINEGIIKDSSVADYGFVAAKTDYTTTAQATDSFISKVTLGAANTVKRSCVGTVNSFCGVYGTNASRTKYKYVTLAVEDVPANQGFVVRFYVKTKSGKVFYANYNTEYTGCVTSFANLNSSVS